AAIGSRLLYSQAVTGAWSGIKFCSLHPASYRSVVRKIRIIAGFLKLFIIRLVSYWAVRFTRKVV
ncbi:hypothetical protein, partial [Phascolarctobacterium faecium]|uniref:hypothetical protein n=1 Tax=Phascolarctobacterium faecium TaxID=33025 RepID=UPI003AB6129E